MSHRRIPIGDLPIGAREKEALVRVIASSRVSEWREVRAFEEEYADWIGTKYCVAVSSGTAALICGLQAMKVTGMLNDGDRVLMPALTFAATANAVVLSGLTPLFGDIDPVTLCLRPDQVTDCELVLPVHLMGYAADLSEIGVAAGDIPLAEDAAEAHGTYYASRRVGSFGLWSAFSFYIAHTVQAGEFGCVCTDDFHIARAVRRLKAHGRFCACDKCTRNTTGCPFYSNTDPRFTHLYPGYNFKPMEWAAAIARIQLSNVEENIKSRLANVLKLNIALDTVSHKVILPHYDESVGYMGYPLVLRQDGVRQRVMTELSSRGVECRPIFGCLPTQQPAYADFAKDYTGKLPVAERIGANGFYVGCHQYLDADDIDYLAQTIIEVVERYG